MSSNFLNKEEWVLETESSLIDLEKWQSVINLIGEICNTPAAFIVQYTTKGYQVVIASQTETNPYHAGVIIPADLNIFCRKVVTTNSFLYENYATSNPEWGSNPEVSDDQFNTYLGFPVRWPDGELFGTCCVMDYAITDFAKKYIELVREFAGIIENDLKLIDQQYNLEKISMTDELTGLYNRRGFLNIGKEKIALAKRLGQSASILYCDIDNMKIINDSYGHSAGDNALVMIASRIKDTLRQYDLATRIGGDEFVILCLVKNKDEVSHIIERLRESIVINSPKEILVSMSIGRADIDENTDTELEDMLTRADIKMYEDKNLKSN